MRADWIASAGEISFQHGPLTKVQRTKDLNGESSPK